MLTVEVSVVTFDSVACAVTNPPASKGPAVRLVLPKLIVPAMNVTFPVGERPKLPPLGFATLCVSTIAVSVIGAFGAIEVKLELIVALVAPGDTVSATPEEEELV